MRSWLLIATLLLTAVACGRSGVLSGGGPTADDDDDDDDDDAITPAFCSSSNAGLIGCWEFEGSFADASANGWAVTSANVGFAPGSVGSGALFSAASAFTLPGTSMVVGSKGGLTVEAWINPDVIPAPGTRFGIIDRPNPYSMFLTPGGILRCGGREFVHASAGILAGTWTHVACTDGPTYVAAFVNGVRYGLVPVTNDMPVSIAGQVHVGEDDPDGDDQFLGGIDELRVFALQLDSAAIAQSASRGP